MGNLQVVEQTKRIVVLTFSDRLDAFNAPNARAEIDGLLADGAVNFVVDLTEVSFMDSAGVAVMVNLLKRSRQAGMCGWYGRLAKQPCAFYALRASIRFLPCLRPQAKR